MENTVDEWMSECGNLIFSSTHIPIHPSTVLIQWMGRTKSDIFFIPWTGYL